MSNNTYAIPLKKLYDEAHDASMASFTESLGINLNVVIPCKYPTVIDIKQAITNIGLEISVEQNKNFHGEEGWCCGIKESGEYDTPVSVDKIKSKTEPITEILSFPRGKWSTAIKLLLELEKVTGPIIFLCDSGQMTLIKQGRTLKEILKELD